MYVRVHVAYEQSDQVCVYKGSGVVQGMVEGKVH